MLKHTTTTTSLHRGKYFYADLVDGEALDLCTTEALNSRTVYTRSAMKDMYHELRKIWEQDRRLRKR